MTGCIFCLQVDVLLTVEGGALVRGEDLWTEVKGTVWKRCKWMHFLLRRPLTRCIAAQSMYFIRSASQGLLYYAQAKVTKPSSIIQSIL